MIYYPYPAHDGKHKYYIITKTGKKIYFGAAGYSDFTIHKDEERKQRYINRHKTHEDWGDIETAGALSRWLLWNKTTLQASIKDMNERFKNYHFLLRL